MPSPLLALLSLAAYAAPPPSGAGLPLPDIRVGVPLAEAEWKELCTKKGLQYAAKTTAGGNRDLSCVRTPEEMKTVQRWASGKWSLTSIRSHLTPDTAIWQVTVTQVFDGASPEVLASMFIDKYGSAGLQPCVAATYSPNNCMDSHRFRRDFGNGAVDVQFAYKIMVGDSTVNVHVTFNNFDGKVTGWLTVEDWPPGGIKAAVAPDLKRIRESL